MMKYYYLLNYIYVAFASPLQQPLIQEKFKIPSIHESAVQARRILSLTDVATLSTVYQHDSPYNLSGTPIGLMDYYADCENKGEPIILAIDIATSFKNVEKGSKLSLSLRWGPKYGKRKPANLPRFALIGHLIDLSEDEVKNGRVKSCFEKKHPDSIAWFPGNKIHSSKWTRLIVERIYWVGGFGDRAYIGWIPLEEWKSVTTKEIEMMRLPGE